MTNAQMLEKMSPQLLKVVERAKREPEGRFNSLAHLIDVPALERAYGRSRKAAAVGVDGVTKVSNGSIVSAQGFGAPIRRFRSPSDSTWRT